MKRLQAVLPILLLALASHAYGHGSDPDVHSFNWAIVDGGSESMSSMEDVDEVTRLEHQWGDTFLYIHEDSDRYVIRDRALMDRAEAALKPVRDSKGVVATWKAQGRASRLDKKIAKLSRKTASAEVRGERTEDLERHQARGQNADESLDRALKGARREMRAILEEAKSRHLAKRVE